MNKTKIAEDYLREEYNSLLPKISKEIISLETKIRWHLREIIYQLNKL